jgi:NTE family protein
MGEQREEQIGTAPAGADRQTKTALVLSAGAPHSPLMAGVLCAFVEENKTFDIIHTSGAGALVGLLFVAPKDKSPAEALKGLLDLGVSDLIYRHLPVYRFFPANYKAFFKPGPFTRPIHRLAQHFKLPALRFAPTRETRSPGDRSPEEERADALVKTWEDAFEKRIEQRVDAFRRLYNDLIDLWAAAITPAPLFPWSKGLCAPLPFLEDLVDFGKLRAFKGEFYVNAFSADDARRVEPRRGRSGTGSGIRLFDKDEIGPAEVRAAFAYPFIYTPVKIDGKLYFEGADRDPISFGNLLRKIELVDQHGNLVETGGTVKTIVLIDILASLSQYLLREPRNLWDAYGISIMVPVVAHAQKEVARFERLHERIVQEQRRGPRNFLKLSFDDFAEDFGPQITDWSYSNMSSLFEIGLKAGRKFLDEHGDKLPQA